MVINFKCLNLDVLVQVLLLFQHSRIPKSHHLYLIPVLHLVAVPFLILYYPLILPSQILDHHHAFLLLVRFLNVRFIKVLKVSSLIPKELSLMLLKFLFGYFIVLLLRFEFRFRSYFLRNLDFLEVERDWLEHSCLSFLRHRRRLNPF